MRENPSVNPRNTVFSLTGAHGHRRDPGSESREEARLARWDIHRVVALRGCPPASARCPPARPWGLHTRHMALSQCAEITGAPGSSPGRTNDSLCGQASLHLTPSRGGVAVHDVTLTVVGASSMQKVLDEGGKRPRNHMKNSLCNQADAWGGEGLAWSQW